MLIQEIIFQLDLDVNANEADTSTYTLNGEWALLGMCI